MEEQNKPVHIHWDVTGKCNLNCRHCRATSASNRRELTTEEGMALIDQIAGIVPDWMSFDGGEPLVRKDVFKLIEYASKKDIFIYLLSNGTMITDEIALKLKGSGVDSVQISIDGLKEKHDYIRGTGNYEKACNGIDKLIHNGIRTSVRMTVSRYNIDDAIGLLEKSIQLGAAAFGIRRVICVGNAKNDSQAVDERQYLQTINDILKACDGRIPIHIGMDPVLIPVTEIKDRILQDEGTLDVLAGCGAGISLLHIGSNGDIYPCGVLQIKVGNILEDSILDVWRSNELLCKLRDRDQLKGRCGECTYKYVCGGCRAFAWAETGDPLESDSQCLLDYVNV